MIDTQGFVVINAFVNNTPGTTAPLGELSTWSRTYSREKGEYGDPQNSGLQLVTMRVINTLTQMPTIVTGPQVKEILEITQACIDYANANVRPYDPSDFYNTISAAFRAKVNRLVFGDLVDNGTIALPSFLSWTSTEEGGNTIKVWLSDEAFADQYTDYTITVVPPVSPVDVLVGPFSTARDKITALTPSMIADNVQDCKGKHPETYYRVFSFILYNRFNPTESVTCSWPVLIYGKNGDNVDAIKDAITQYILDHSTVLRPAWEQVLPDLFKRTEFIILPRWKKQAVENLTHISGLYSSLTKVKEAVSEAVAAIDFYSSPFVENSVTVLPYPYRCLALLVVPGENNVQGKTDFSILFSDYLPIASTSPDFNRMKVKTRDWLLFIDDMIIMAEKATKITTLPANMRRTIRGDKLYISALYDGINYLVDARSNNR